MEDEGKMGLRENEGSMFNRESARVRLRCDLLTVGYTSCEQLKCM